MLRNAVVHLHNEQPLLADLLFEPTQTDTVLICRNLRSMNGKKPVFVDQIGSTFILPLAHVRFVEIRQAAVEEFMTEKATHAAAAEEAAQSGLSIPDKSSWLDDSPPTEPARTGRGRGSRPKDPNPEGLDDDLLRRVRDA
jgi:hypothetical protein